MKRAWLAASLLILSGCTGLFYQPTDVLYRHPEDYGLKYEAVRFPSLDGTGLTGIFLFASTGPVRGTVIQYHGNGENMTSHFLFAAWLTARGYNVLAFDYRGYGASEGAADQEGVVEDGMAVVRYARGRKDVDPDRLVIWGESLGGAVAVASLGRGEGKGVRAVILESTFDSYRDMARAVMARSWIFWPVQWPLSRLLISDREAPYKYFGRLPPCPVLVVHSEADEIVPFRLGEKLFKELREPKGFWKVGGARHLEVFARKDWPYRDRLTEFLNRATEIK